MSDSVRPHRQQPTRIFCPWDSPGKNTGVGCHSLLQCMKVKSESEVAQLCPTLSDPMDCSLPGSCTGPWDSPGKNTGVGCHSLLHTSYITLGKLISLKLSYHIYKMGTLMLLLTTQDCYKEEKMICIECSINVDNYRDAAEERIFIGW